MTDEDQPMTDVTHHNDIRLQETARLTGDSIRAAVQHVATNIMALVTDAEKEVSKLRLDAEDFCASLTDIGEAHAARIEEALGDLHHTMTLIREERQRVSMLTAAAPKNGQQ